jgi:hypothetical protein
MIGWLVVDDQPVCFVGWWLIISLYLVGWLAADDQPVDN